MKDDLLEVTYAYRSNAPMSTIATPLKLPSFLRAKPGPRWSVGGTPALSPVVDGPAAGEERVRLGLPAVVGQRAELRVDRVDASCRRCRR